MSVSPSSSSSLTTSNNNNNNSNIMLDNDNMNTTNNNNNNNINSNLTHRYHNHHHHHHEHASSSGSRIKLTNEEEEAITDDDNDDEENLDTYIEHGNGNGINNNGSGGGGTCIPTNTFINTNHMNNINNNNNNNNHNHTSHMSRRQQYHHHNTQQTHHQRRTSRLSFDGITQLWDTFSIEQQKRQQERKKKLKKLKVALMDILHEDHPPEDTEHINAQFATPGQMIQLVAKGGIGKSRMTVDQMLILGFMGGCFIGFGGLLAYSVIGESPFLVANPGISRYVFGVLFPIALVLIALTGSELYTGNAFILVPALLNRKISVFQFVKNWVVVFSANIVGSLFMAYIFGYWAMKLAVGIQPVSNIYIPGNGGNGAGNGNGANNGGNGGGGGNQVVESLISMTWMAINGTMGGGGGGNGTDVLVLQGVPAWVPALIRNVEIKSQKPWYLVFLQAVGANWCVCLAVYLSISARDILSKVVVSIMPISIFVCLGWEHCIANAFLLPLGMMYGANISIGTLIINVAWATIGNGFAGVFCIGIPYWYVYSYRMTHYDIFDRFKQRTVPCVYGANKKKDEEVKQHLVASNGNDNDHDNDHHHLHVGVGGGDLVKDDHHHHMETVHEDDHRYVIELEEQAGSQHKK